jgi:TetR/AcrR family transcriptional regulator
MYQSNAEATEMPLRFQATDEAVEKFDTRLSALTAAWRRDPRSADKRRAAIRAAGTRMLADRGLDGANLKEITASVGIAATSYGNYYRNRDELIHDILHHHFLALDAALDAVDPLPWPPGEPDQRLAVPPVQRLEEMARALLDAMAEHEAGQRVLLAALHTLPELGQDNLCWLYRNLIRRIERVLPLAIPRLARRRALVTPLAMSFFAMAGNFVLWFRDDGRLSRAEYARLMVRMTVDGGKAAFRGDVGKARGMGKRALPEAALLRDRARC